MSFAALDYDMDTYTHIITRRKDRPLKLHSKRPDAFAKREDGRERRAMRRAKEAALTLWYRDAED